LPSEDRANTAARAGAVIVRVDVAAFAPGVTDDGDIPQDGIGADPLTAHVARIELLNAPFWGVNVMTSVPCPPLLTLKVDEAALTLKSTVPKVAVTAAAALLMVTVHVPVPLQPLPLHPVNVDPEAAVAVRTTGPSAKFALHVAPQLIPAGALVTVPAPVPAKVTVTGYVVRAKVAVTACACVMLTEHVPVPEHAPLQPVNVDPAAGLSVSTTVPLNDAEQVAPQLIPAGALVTVPVPAPASVTVRGYVVRAKVAVTACA